MFCKFSYNTKFTLQFSVVCEFIVQVSCPRHINSLWSVYPSLLLFLRSCSAVMVLFMPHFVGGSAHFTSVNAPSVLFLSLIVHVFSKVAPPHPRSHVISSQPSLCQCGNSHWSQGFTLGEMQSRETKWNTWSCSKLHEGL